MYSVEVWKEKACRVIGSSGSEKGARDMAEDRAKAPLLWEKTNKRTWEAFGVDGSRFVMIDHTREFS